MAGPTTQKPSSLFKHFLQSEKAGGLILLACTLISLVISNSPIGNIYTHWWHAPANLDLGSVQIHFTVEEWINDGLMAVFFLMVGLEIERELYIGELTNIRNALLPILAAVGGMLVPALIHFGLNHGTDTQPGFGIPMATDIAFSLGMLSLLGSRVPVQLKIFLTAVAIIDDLGAVILIAIFYTKQFSVSNLLISLAVFGVLVLLNRLNVFKTWIYLLLGLVMWYFMEKSGVHATISGVLLAFAIPFRKAPEKNPSHKLQHALHNPVNLIIIPLFALANTGIHLGEGWTEPLKSPNSIGIMAGLLLGKSVGIFVFGWIAVALKWCLMPDGVSMKMLLSTSVLGAIGFTMSIFISNLAFEKNPSLVQQSKIAVLLASLTAAALGLLLLHLTCPKLVGEVNSDQKF